jgi:hypothetical protein
VSGLLASLVIAAAQLPPAQWHDYLADATLADAICDRLLHNAHRIVLTLAEKGGQARRLTGPASLRSDHDPPISLITIERSG